MELMDAIEKRRTVRDYLNKPVPDEVIRKALRAGLKAPSYNHQKELFFIRVYDPKLRLALTVAERLTEEVSPAFLKKLNEDYEALARDMYMDAIPKQKKMIMNAPELLIVGYKPKTQIPESKNMSDLNCHAAVWCCIENILLSLAEDDVYATTIVPENTPGIKSILNIPQELEVAVLLTVGYKAPDARIIPQKEVAVESVLFTDRWR
jgi:nitroreductase